MALLFLVGKGLQQRGQRVLLPAPGSYSSRRRRLWVPLGGMQGPEDAVGIWLRGYQNPQPCSTAASMAGASRPRGAAQGGHPGVCWCLSFPQSRTVPGLCSHPKWQRGFCAAWLRVGEQSARPAGCEIASLEAAHGLRD